MVYKRNYITIIIQLHRGKFVWSVSRQTGKCLHEDTLVATPNGPSKIKDIKIGDYVIGYNSDGTTSPTEVKQIHKQGKKKVVNINHRGRTIASATKDHRWQGINSHTKKLEILTTEELINSSHKKIKREYFEHHWGDIHEPHAYAIGALLGDGYGGFNSDGSKQVSISSENSLIPEAIAKELGCFYWKSGGKNFSWILGNEYKPKKKTQLNNHLIVNNYNEWCKNKKAHEKFCDWNIIKQWDRDSQIRFIAGLLDTDGCIQVVGRKNNELKFSLSMQARGVIEVVKLLFLHLWQIELCELIDNREKFVNGPCYVVYSNNNFCVKRFLKETSKYIVTPRKQYKPEYDNFSNYNHIPEQVGVVKGEEYEVETYDIGIDNGTHLFCLANGLVTHNSWTVCTIALEEAIKNPGIRMAYIAPELNDAKDITEQTFDQLCEDAPEAYKPKFNSLKNRWEWENGSILKVAGTDNKNYNKIRGRKYDIIFLDEFCFMDEFKKVFFSCVKPTTTSVPNYKIIFISTPPETPDHESNMILDDAEEDGSLIKKTIYDSPRFSAEFIEENILKDYRSLGGKNSIEFRREYLCERIADSSKLVIPEATKEKMAEIVANLFRPEFYNIYESFDWGVKDSNGGLFSYVDFERKILVIEDELLAHDSTATTFDIAKLIIKKEEDNWGDSRKKALRYADNNLQIINDMSLSYNLHMTATNKDNLAAQVQKVRHLLANGQIIINPRCVNLIEQLQSAQWNNTRKSFVRRNGHHYDLVAALIYLVRNCQLEVSPYPVDYKLHKIGYHPDTHFLSPHYKPEGGNISGDFVKYLKNSFTIKKKN